MIRVGLLNPLPLYAGVTQRSAGEGNAEKVMARKDAPSGVFHVSETEARRTLATGLRNWSPGLSWSEAKRLIRGRFVLVDGNLCSDAERRLTAGSVVKLLRTPQPQPADERDVRLLFWDDHVVVVDKPPGVTSVRHASERDWPRRRRQHQPTLEEHVNSILRKATRKHTRVTPVRPVHRLDRDTSGVMVFAPYKSSGTRSRASIPRTLDAARLFGRR